MAQIIKQVHTPGVYITEISGPASGIQETATAVPAFIGYTQKAIKLEDEDLNFIPHRIISLSEFEKFYGGSAGQLQFTLYHSMQLYFTNGGTDCYIVSIGNYKNIPQKGDFVRGLDAIREESEPTLLLFPEAVNLPGDDLYDVQNAALKQAAELGDRFCILDLKFADDKDKHAAAVSEFRKNIGPGKLEFGAAYSPYLKTTGGIVLPPSSAIAGQYCSVDRNDGVWKAPANIALNGVAELLYTINDKVQEDLNIDVREGKSINAIRKFAGRGILIWGARTLNGNDNEWRYISVRRFYNMIEETLTKACLNFVFEPNDTNTWAAVKIMIENYLTVKWKEGALSGAKSTDAFFVKLGLGETMTAADILEGRMNIKIGMAPLPAEFIFLTISQKMMEK